MSKLTNPNPFFDNPTIQVTVNSVDVSLFGITVQTELPENGISNCTFTANNDDAKAYLQNLHIGDEVVIKGLADSTEGYLSEGSINWSTVAPFFVGTIQELHPMLSKSGQLCSVVVYGNGYQLKQMRAAQEYGYIIPVESWGFVYGYDDSITTKWITQGSDPYIGGYSYYHFIELYLSSLPDSNGIGAFTFRIDEEFNGGQLSKCELHIVAGLYPFPYDGSHNTNHATSVTITPYWSIDGGNHWNAFHGTTTGIGELTGNPNATSFLVTSVITPPVASWLFNIPYWGVYTGGYDTFLGYNPVTNYSHGPPTGQDLGIDVTVDLAINGVPYWNSNFEVKLVVTSYTGSQLGGVSVAEMYLDYNFNTFEGKTVRQLLAGEQGTKGLIPTFVNNTLQFYKYYLNGTVPSYELETLSSGWTPLGTNYIVLDSYNAGMTNGYGTTDANFDNYLIPYLKFPYEDSLTALQEIIKYESALRFFQSKSGYHWMIDTNANLLVAPCSNGGSPSSSNHHVYGIDSSHYVDSNMSGTTIPWVSQPYPTTPIVVKETMLVENFKQEPPIANFVLISGKFQYPLHDDICRGSASPWLVYAFWTGTLANNELVVSSSYSSKMKVDALLTDTGWEAPCLELHTVSPASLVDTYIFSNSYKHLRLSID